MIINDRLDFFNGSVGITLECAKEFHVEMWRLRILSLPDFVTVVADLVVPAAATVATIKVYRVSGNPSFRIEVHSPDVFPVLVFVRSHEEL